MATLRTEAAESLAGDFLRWRRPRSAGLVSVHDEQRAPDSRVPRRREPSGCGMAALPGPVAGSTQAGPPGALADGVHGRRWPCWRRRRRSVSYAAQYRMVFAAKGVAPVAALEAAIPDVAALIFATLGIALALHGRRAIRARVLNVAAVATSVAMNVLAAGHGWRDLAIWAMPPVAYALASDTAIGVVRAWTLARQKALNEALADDEATPLAILGGLLLWLLRLGIAPGLHAGRVPRLGGRGVPGRSRPPRPPSPAQATRAQVAPRPAQAITAAGQRGAAARGSAGGHQDGPVPGPGRRPVRAARGLPAGRRVAGQRRAGPRGRPRPRRRPVRAAPPRPVPANGSPGEPFMQHFPYFACSCPACWCWRCCAGASPRSRGCPGSGSGTCGCGCICGCTRAGATRACSSCGCGGAGWPRSAAPAGSARPCRRGGG